MRRTPLGGIGTGHGDVAQSELLKLYVIVSGFQHAVAPQLCLRRQDPGPQGKLGSKIKYPSFF